VVENAYRARLNGAVPERQVIVKALRQFLRRVLPRRIYAAFYPFRFYLRWAPSWLPRSAGLARIVDEAMRRWDHRFKVRTKSGPQIFGTTSDLIQRYIYLFGAWEPNLSEFLTERLRPGDVFVDVGANIGYFTLLASRVVGPTGSVVACEASPDAARQLRRNLQLNGFSNVRVVAVAVHRDERDLVLHAGSPGNSGTATTTTALPGSTGRSILVRAQPLAKILKPEELSRLRVIKIDIEGGEFDALHGLLPVLPEVRTEFDVVMEVTPHLLEAAGHSPADVHDTMARHGFGAVRLLPNRYDVESYLQPAIPPVPYRRDADHGQADLVFTRMSRETLAEA
jgi:FkbM family methyltransferase